MSERFRHPHYAKLVIFQAPNGQSENWYAGFYHQSRFVRKSTQTDSKKDALDIAKKWYLQQQHLLEEGHSITSARRRFKDAVEFVKDDMVVKRNSETYQKSLMNLLSDTSYVGQFFGNLPVESITSSTWDDYRTWLFKKRGEEEKPVQSEKTIHQHKIAVQRDGSKIERKVAAVMAAKKQAVAIASNMPRANCRRKVPFGIAQSRPQITKGVSSNICMTNRMKVT